MLILYYSYNYHVEYNSAVILITINLKKYIGDLKYYGIAVDFICYLNN